MDADKKISVENLEKFILEWNNRFKYDRAFRKKYNIPFGSKQHLEANQIDMYLDILEDRMADKFKKEIIQREADKKYFKETGRILKERKEDEAEAEKLLKKFRFR